MLQSLLGFWIEKKQWQCVNTANLSVDPSACCKRLDLPLDFLMNLCRLQRRENSSSSYVILEANPWNPPWSLCCHTKDEENCIIHLHLKKNWTDMGVLKFDEWECWNQGEFFFFELQYYATTCQPHLFPSILGLFPDQTTTSQWQKETSSVASRSEKKPKRQKVQNAYCPHISKCI